ncbi:hypothetical protein [Streptomyces sp. NPDC008001]|uniref:hypothetical protein n=1 Tax=Streptomyces sp. NPDC008001 TaxID=3364804 RepID=UPI0036E8C39E
MTTGLRIKAGAAVAPTAHKAWVPAPEELMYIQDLYRPFGIRADEGLLKSGAGISHTDLARLLLEHDPGTTATAQHADLVVVAHGLPDLHPFTPVSPYVLHRLGGTGLRFAVSEQGASAPFTALRIASAFHRSGRARTTAVVIVEQSTHPARDAALDRAGPTDSGALLVLSAEGDGEHAGLRIDAVSAVRAANEAQATACLSRELSRYRAEGSTPRTLAVLGPHVSPGLQIPDGIAVHRVDRPGYSTGVWRELAERHADWAGSYDQVVLCETDALRPERADLLALRGPRRDERADRRAAGLPSGGCRPGSEEDPA